jgi:hypothetical protein
MSHMAQTHKRIRKLSTAVFRGSRSEYNFDVYPISTAITDHPVVFIFSRRRVDKSGRAHHAVSCVGETKSIVSEIKKHKRARCVKGNEANVICIFKEGDSRIRSAVLDDLASVRGFSCVQGKFKPINKPKLEASMNKKIAKLLPFKPLSGTDSRSVVNAIGQDDRRKSCKKSAANENVKPAQKRLVSASKEIKKAKTLTGVKRVVDHVESHNELSKPRKSVARGTKARTAHEASSRKKLAA